MEPPSARVANIERAIRAYLRAHPQAVDTERGIGEWWLRGMQASAAPADVHAAIQRLVASGGLASLALPDGQIAYTSGRGDRQLGPH